MKYILKDKYNNTQKEVNEKDLRDLYYKTLEGLEFSWKDCNDNEILDGFKVEKEQVYTTNIKNVIKRIEEDNWFYAIIEKEW